MHQRGLLKNEAILLKLIKNKQIEESKTEEIQFKLKPYIQPFEKILAYEELKSLAKKNLEISELTFNHEASEDYSVLTAIPQKIFQEKVAYWERVGNKDKEMLPTLQVVYEQSPDNLFSVDNQVLLNSVYQNYPKTRKLRYGVHDLHEYRGKFFPQMVKSLINISGVSEGSTVLDPYCGSGTTSVEANVAGMHSLGLDLNPLSVKISKTKTEILNIDGDVIYTEAINIIERLDNPIDNTPENQWDSKDLTYLKRWFDPFALKEISNILKAIDLANNDVVKNLFEICLSNIVRTISWQKKSDLRVRKEITKFEVGNTYVLFIDEVKRQVNKLIPYLEIIKQKAKIRNTKVVEGDTKEVNIHFNDMKGKCDVLITSPPYATALPYLDTDRLSLIVLGLLPRELHKNRDLEMIGNREVTEKQRKELWDLYQNRKTELPQSIVNFIDELGLTNHQDNVGFRRKNLPALLGKYFIDMLDSMRNSLQMMKPNTFGFYVVGNNSTTVENSKKIIPTDIFLWETGKKVGWKQVSVINMELLQSRDIFSKNRGSSESILVFKSPEIKTLERTAVYSTDDVSEYRIQGEQWNFNGEATQEHLHSIHPYPARFIPQIPRKAILEWTSEGDTVLDPFCGSGTTLLESILHGRKAIGIDNNSVACLISNAKVTKYTNEDIEVLKLFVAEIESLKSIASRDAEVKTPNYKNLEYWFDKKAINDLGRISWKIEQLEGNSKILVQALFSSIIVKISYQDSDTRYARKEYKYLSGNAIDFFVKKLKKGIKSLEKIVALPKETADVYQLDGKNLESIDDNSVNMIVTSPPYLNAYDYHKYHRHRIHWTDGDVSLARDKEIGKHDTFTRPNANPDKYFEDMSKCFDEWKRILISGGKVLLVIGDAIVNKQSVPVAERFIELMEDINFNLDKRWIRKIKTSRKSFNQSARMDEEHVLLFSKVNLNKKQK